MDDTGMDIHKGITKGTRVFLTGGGGTLGRAILRRATSEGWGCQFTVYSRDPLKHFAIKRDFPGVLCRIGDIRDYDQLGASMAGHDCVIHAAAFKFIDLAEVEVSETFDINVNGSRNVALAAVQNGVKQVIGVTTDKECHPINCYGMTKGIMSRLFVEFNRLGLTTFHLCRYGNVLGSNGSVLRVWREQLERDGYVTATDPDMTRFWITEDEAVDLVLAAYNAPAGTTVIPLAPALDMRRFAEYTMPVGTQFKYVGLRPGEKMHEELITAEETKRATYANGVVNGMMCAILGDKEIACGDEEGYVSNNAHWLTRPKLLAMLGES